VKAVHEDDLERLIDRELKHLPVPRAPRSLLPRVMAAIEAPRLQPWYSRPWLSWPRVWQGVSVACVAVLALGVWTVWAEAPGIVQWFNRVAVVSRALWNVLFGPIAFIVIGLIVVVSLACAAAWTAVSRVTFGGASSQ
jgi:hypothetical protein